MKRILHLNWWGVIGGTERFTFTLASKQKAMGLKPVIGYMTNSNVWFLKCHDTHVPVVEFNMKNGYDLFHFFNYIIFLYKFRPDIIHAHDPTPLVYLTKLIYPKCKFIRHIHGSSLGNEQWEKSRVILWNKLLLRYIDHFIANSNHTRNILIKKCFLPPERISIVFNGIDFDVFKTNKNKATMRNELSINPGAFVIGSIGRLSKEKGFELFIEVANKLVKYNDNYKFIIVGDGDQRSMLMKKAKDLNLTQHIIFTGSRTDIPELLSVFDIFLMTSKWEAFGIVLLEAMCMGVPIITFRVDGISEVVNERTAIMIEPWDIAQMTEKIILLHKDKEQRNILINNGLIRVRDFDINRISHRINDLYASLMN